MLSLAEQRATDAALTQAAALIKEARQRRRRRWITGTAAVALAGAGVTAGTLLTLPAGTPHAANAAAARPAAPTSCASAITNGPLPVWARAGFQPPDQAMPYAFSAGGDIVAILWAQHDPLVTPAPPGRNNKILWAAKALTGGPLQITAQRLVGGTPVGPVQHRTVAVGPSTVDMPTAGCWRFTLHWPGHTDTVALPYAAG